MSLPLCSCCWTVKECIVIFNKQPYLANINVYYGFSLIMSVCFLLCFCFPKNVLSFLAELKNKQNCFYFWSLVKMMPCLHIHCQWQNEMVVGAVYMLCCYITEMRPWCYVQHLTQETIVLQHLLLYVILLSMPPIHALRLRFMRNAWLCVRYKLSSSYYYYIPKESLLMTAQVLWPYLFELLVIGEYSASLSVLARSIHNIASRKRTSGDADYYIDFVVHGYLLSLVIFTP